MLRSFRVGWLLLLALLAGCGAQSLPTPTPAPAPVSSQAVFAASTLVVGANRLPIGIVSDGTPINDPDTKVHLLFYYLDGDQAASQTVAGETDAIYFGKNLPFGVYVAYPNFPKAGAWGVEVQMLRPNLPVAVSKLRLDVLAQDPTPAIGSQAIAFDSPTGATPEELKKITSAPEPDPALYQISVAAALKQGKPLAILFGTPGFCKTATCGPSIEVMRTLRQSYGDALNVIHVESYAYPFGESAQASPPRISEGMERWRLGSEPWVFLIDRQGMIRYKYEGGITLDELKPVVENLIKLP